MVDDIYSDSYIGTVLKIDKKNRRIGVYIPKLMSEISGEEEFEYSVPTNAGLNIENIETNISAVVKKINYIWVQSLDYLEPLPNIGSKVFVEFIDNNPNLPYWTKFNINNDYSVIEEEKYKKLYQLQIGNKKYDIEDDDNIIIDLPDYFNVTEVIDEDNSKEKHFQIKENYNFYLQYGLEESISKLQKSISFIEHKYETTFVNNLKTYQPALFNDTDQVYLIDKYKEYRNNAITKIKDSEDLSETNEIYLYYYKLLDALSGAYDNYKVYLNKFLTSPNKDYISSKDISQSIIDANIKNIFETAESVSNRKNIDDYSEYVKEIFSPTVIYEYHYLDDTGVRQVYIPKEKSEVFSLFDPNTIKIDFSTVEPDLSASTYTTEVASLSNDPDYIKKSCILYSWNDENNRILCSRSGTSNDIKFENKKKYCVEYNTRVYPKFYGLYTYVNNFGRLQVYFINTTNLKITSISGKLEYYNDVAKEDPFTFDALEEINYMLMDLSKRNDIEKDPSLIYKIKSLNVTMKMMDPDDETAKIQDAIIGYTEVK